MSKYHVQISIPKCLDTILASPILAARKIWYGYSFRRVKLIGGKYAIVDNADFHKVSKYVWWLKDNNGCCKAVRFTAGANCGKSIYMHREIFYKEETEGAEGQRHNEIGAKGQRHRGTKGEELNIEYQMSNNECRSEGEKESNEECRISNNQCRKKELNDEYRVQNSEYRNTKFETRNPKLVVDHINRDGLDNRRGNLRIATRSQNNMNRSGRRGTSSGLKGVSWYEKKKYWRAMIQVEGKCYSLGHFEREEDAARAYDKAAKKYHGQYAYLNFPPENYQGLRGTIKHFIPKIRNTMQRLVR